MAISTPSELIASVDDFKLALPECEVIELTQLDDVNATTPDDGKIQFALDQAYAYICAFDAKACPAGKVAIRLRAKRSMIVIARYEMDVLHRRPDVEKEYERILEFLKDCTDKALCDCDVDPDELAKVGLSPNQNQILSCFDDRRWTVPDLSDKLNENYFTNHRIRSNRDDIF